jgi:hypothetical protein
LDSSLNDVTGGLAVAFDTTAIALTYSLVLGFTSLFVKRSEEHLLDQIDEHCRLEINRCFPEGPASHHPLLEAEQRAAEELIKQTTSLVDRQTRVWGDAVSAWRREWVTAADEQRQHIVESLQAGQQLTLSHHAQQLSQTQEHHSQVQAEISRRLIADFDELLLRREQSEASLVSSLERAVQSLADAFYEQALTQSAEREQLLAGFGQQIERWQAQAGGWQNTMSELTQQLINLNQTLLEQGTKLEQIAAQDELLVRVQDQLARNLETVRAAETFDETLHNLAAAVHLLTARVRVRDAA